VKNLILNISACFALFAGASVAEDQIEEVVVVGEVLFQDQINALKTPTPVINVPQSVVVVSSGEIKKRGFTSIADIVNHVPGLNTSQGEGHRDAVVFRGVRSTADFFLDGFRDDVQYYRPLYNLEQVEVLKGPNALLFGRGGTGGVLNRVTKKGWLGESFTDLGVAANSFGGLSLQIDRNMGVSESSAFRVNGYYESLENHRDFFDGDQFGFNPTAKFKLSDATVLDLSYEYIDQERFIDRGIPTGTDGRPVRALRNNVFGDPLLNTTELEANLFKAMVQHRFSDAMKGNFSVFYGDYEKMYQNFYAAKYDQSKTPNEVTLDGYVDTTQRENLQISGNVIAELQTGIATHTLLFGLEVIDTTSDQDRFNTYFDTSESDKENFSISAGLPLALVGGRGTNSAGQATVNDFALKLNDDTHVEIEARSLYVQDEIQLSEKLIAILGGRYDEFDIEVVNVKSAEIRNRKDDEISPRVGLIYKPQENTSIYLSYSESFLPRSGEQFANINGDNNQLDPDTFENLELGIKWNANEALSLSASVFEIDKKSPQVADNDPSTLDVIESSIDGFEVQIQGKLNSNWSINASYGYLDGEQVNRSGNTGLRPRELPENMFSLWTMYQVTPKFGLGIGVSYQDESFINNSNSATLPSYTRIDAAVFYEVSEDLMIQLHVENLSDRVYFPNAHSTHQASVGEEVNARLSLQWAL
jgi:catecholate siderophore receptor|tara:strand:+ start:224 stop:2326 length:2103 start_codon:yes stop_codon:yes gene_type:complete